MKTLTTLLAVITLAAPALSAASFEGTVKMNMQQPGEQPMPVTFSIKPGFTRMDVQAGGQTMATIVDQQKKEATMLMPEQKMYMVHSLANMEKQAAERSDDTDATIEKTSEHEKIAGYDATKYIIKSKGTTTDLWATEDLGTFVGMGSGGPQMGGGRGRRSANAQAWEKVLRGKEIFPLRVVSHDANGKESFRMETTEVKKQSLPDAVFAPPADYQKFDMGNMMRGMMPGMPGMPGGRRPPKSGE